MTIPADTDVIYNGKPYKLKIPISRWDHNTVLYSRTGDVLTVSIDQVVFPEIEKVYQIVAGSDKNKGGATYADIQNNDNELGVAARKWNYASYGGEVFPGVVRFTCDQGMRMPQQIKVKWIVLKNSWVIEGVYENTQVRGRKSSQASSRRSHDNSSLYDLTNDLTSTRRSQQPESFGFGGAPKPAAPKSTNAMTLAQLKDAAQRLQLRGRSSMNKAQLLAALRKRS